MIELSFVEHLDATSAGVVGRAQRRPAQLRRARRGRARRRRFPPARSTIASWASAEEFGPYLVYEQIGLGGMATVHRAETQRHRRVLASPVALKRMLPNVAADENLVQSFMREARLASHLRHANVAQTYDLGKVGDIYFIAMELVPGRNLREMLQALPARRRCDAAADRDQHHRPDRRRARLRAQPVRRDRHAARHHPSRRLAVERDRQRGRRREADRLRHREGIAQSACRR